MSILKQNTVVLCICFILLVVCAGSENQYTVLAASLEQPAIGITVPYTGQLNDNLGQPVGDGKYTFEFQLYGSGEGGELLWSELQEGVLLKDGLFNVSLGSVKPIPQELLAGESGWLGIAVRGPGEGQFTELSPRQQLNATASASPLSTSAGMTCAHDHFGEQWIGNSSTSGIYVKNTNASGGAGIVANSESGPALSIDKGSLQVKDAGLGTDTPAFIHQVVTTGINANLCTKGSWHQDYSTVIDHPMTNGNPGAILFITSNYGLASSWHTGPAHAPYGVYYDDQNQCGYGTDKWVIYATDTTELNNGQLFNVLVVVP